MKLVKGLFLTLIFSAVCAASGVSAIIWSQGYGDISIPAFQGTWSNGEWIWKQSETGYQYLETIESADPIFFNPRVVQARTRHVAEPLSSTSWKDAPRETTINWGNANSAFGVYELDIKNKSFTLNSTRYWGVWYW